MRTRTRAHGTPTVRLFDFAYACALYPQLTDYDRGLNRFFGAVDHALDPFNLSHREALFSLLNDMGCRQFALRDQPTVAGPSLVTWSRKWLPEMPKPSVSLNQIPKNRLGVLAQAYEELTLSLASWRGKLTADRGIPVRYGATGAAKTLFALRPKVFPPWDEPIRRKLRLEPGAAGFERYLTEIRNQLTGLAKLAGCTVAQLPKVVGRPDSSPAKLMDEYNWVIRTRGHAPPSSDQLHRWWTWAKQGELLGEEPPL